MQHYLRLVLLSNFLMVADLAQAESVTSFDQKYWEKILHYQNGESRADGEKFFLSPTGKTDTQAELAATIEAFKNPNLKSGWFDYHPQCVFRERFDFLKKSGLLEGVAEVGCPEFEEWKSGLNAESITLIFSSSYPNNPSSLFGHTLLRLNQKGKTNDLLDYSIAFSAIPEKDDLGIVFALKGIFGGYKGIFEITKYYTKVNEYNNGESRDLIEYNLKTSPEELNRFINHLWELYQTTYFDYYFADENCSAVLADLLAVAYKDDDRVNHHARWYYLPGEMIKHFYSLENRVESTRYRPSLKKQMSKRWDRLSSDEVSDVKKIIDYKISPKDVSKAEVLDAASLYLDFTQNRRKAKLDPKESKLQREILIKRSTLKKEVEQVETYDQSNMPENGHDPQKVTAFVRTENHNTQIGFEVKQGYHDLLSNDQGFDRFSQFDQLSFSFLYDLKKNRLTYDKLMLVDLVSLHEYRYFDPQMAWKAKVLADRIYDLDCSLCHKVGANAYGGYSFRYFDRAVLSFMAGAFVEVSEHLKKGYRAGPGIDISFYAQLGEYYKLGLTNELRYDATKKIKEDFYNQLGLRHSLFFDNKQDYRFESSVISRFGSFKKNTIVHQVSYGYYF